MKKNALSIILVYYNTPVEIIDCIKSIPEAAEDLSYEIIIVNNNSPKPLPANLKRSKRLSIIENDNNYGYGRAINQAVKIAKGEFLLVLNPDTICTKDSIKSMVERIKQDRKIGVLGPQQIDKKEKIIHSIGSMPKLPDALFALSFIDNIWPQNPYSKKFWARDVDRNKEQETETVGGACMLFRKKIFEKIEGFDERFFMYFEEADICLRIKKLGYKILYYPQAKIRHLIGKSNTNRRWVKKTFEESRYKFFKKYYGLPIASSAELFLRIVSV